MKQIFYTIPINYALHLESRRFFTFVLALKLLSGNWSHIKANENSMNCPIHILYTKSMTSIHWSYSTGCNQVT